MYAACALPYNAVASAHWSGLLVYGAMPWAVGTIVSVAGLAPFAPTARPLVARIAALGLLVAVVSAFVPAFAIEVVVVAAVVALASALLGGLEGALRALGATVAAGLLAVVLHLPWIASRLGELGALFGSVPLASPDDRGLDALLRFATGPHDAGVLAYLLLVPAGVALLLGRSWRLAWAGRAVLVAVVFFTIAWSADRGWGPAATVPVDVWLVPAAVGLALAGACGATAVDTDVRGTRFSWRQPLGFLAVVAIGLGVLPTARRRRRRVLGSRARRHGRRPRLPAHRLAARRLPHPLDRRSAGPAPAGLGADRRRGLRPVQQRRAGRARRVGRRPVPLRGPGRRPRWGSPPAARAPASVGCSGP